MVLSASKPLCLLAFLVAGASASPFADLDSSILAAQKIALPNAVSNLVDQHRKLQWTIDFTPDSSPEFVCDNYNTELNKLGSWECSCDIQPDKSIGVKCLELETNCNADSSLCFLQTVTLSMTPQTNIITGLETCSEYVDLNLTRFEDSSTILANYSDIVPCVKVDPIAPGDFSSLAGCSARINGALCQTCEICTDKEPALAITLDCCNTNPEGEQLKVACGEMGGGGAYVPIFDTYEKGSEETCSSAFDLFGSLSFVGLLVTATLVVF